VTGVAGSAIAPDTGEMGGGGGGLGTALTVLVTIVAGVGLIALLGIVYVMWRYRLPPRALVAMVAALFYLVSPVDVLPEAILGPFGLLDDAGVTGATILFVYKLVKTRQMLRDTGVLDRPRRSGAQGRNHEVRGTEARGPGVRGPEVPGPGSPDY
jgi:uncharacterized membrane protein YkvA (DUF1232 family)